MRRRSPRHRLAAFAPAPRRGRRRRGFGAGGCGRRLRCGGHGRGAGGLGRRDGSGGSGRRCRNGFRRPGGRFEMGEHVALGDPAVPAGAGNRRRIESVLVHEPAYRRTQALGTGGGGWCGGFGHRGEAVGCCGGGSPGDTRGGRARIDSGQHLPAQHGVPGVLQYLGEHPGFGRWHLEHHLVGFELDQDLVLRDRVARLLAPLQQRGVRDGLGEHRHLHVDGHWGTSSGIREIRDAGFGRSCSGCVRARAPLPILKRSCAATQAGPGQARSRPGPAAGWCAR